MKVPFGSFLFVTLLSGAFAAPMHNETLGRRETPASTCYTTNEYTEQIGDGDPHVDALHKQVTPPITCAQAGDCATSYATGHTVGWSFEASFGVAPEFTAGTVESAVGFSVEESVTTTYEEQCGGEPGLKVCTWSKIPHAAFTVQQVTEDSCGGKAISEPFIMRDPGPIEFYCVIDTCRNDGDEYWEYNV